MVIRLAIKAGSIHEIKPRPDEVTKSFDSSRKEVHLIYYCKAIIFPMIEACEYPLILGPACCLKEPISQDGSKRKSRLEYPLVRTRRDITSFAWTPHFVQFPFDMMASLFFDN